MIVDKIVEELATLGMDTYFVVTGGAIVPFVDAVGRSSRTNHYCFQHEQSAAMAAEGYYRASGKVGVVLVTSGPGVQNILNGVCGCWYDSIPSLFISGQVNSSESLDSVQCHPRQVGFQEFPVESTFRHCTKYSKKIHTASDIAGVFSEALSTMMSGRKGPVLIDFPVNLQMTSSLDSQSITCIAKPPPTYSCNTVEVTHILDSAVRPLLVLGNGVRETITEVRTWIERSSIPFVTSWGGCDLIEHDHPLRVGNIGVYGDRVANMALQNADVLLILGSRMDTRQTGGNLELCSKISTRIMVDVDIEEIHKLTERGLEIHYPIHSSIIDFITNHPVRLHDSLEWLRILSQWRLVLANEPMRVQGDIYDVLSSIQLPDDCIVIPDTGGNLVWSLQSLKLKKNQRLFSNFGNSSMGYALPAAIGASIGTGKRSPVVCICGDGGIQMNVQELHTLASLDLPITVVVVNNSGYGIIRQFQDQYFESRYTATSSSEVFGSKEINIVKIATAYGLDAVATTKTVNVKMKPFLYDLQIDPSQKIYPKLEFGNSLENMSPILRDIEGMMIAPYSQPNKRGGWVSK